jgi:hypothetical protein
MENRIIEREYNRERVREKREKLEGRGYLKGSKLFQVQFLLLTYIAFAYSSPVNT